jgi:hypothetical protein
MGTDATSDVHANTGANVVTYRGAHAVSNLRADAVNASTNGNAGTNGNAHNIISDV